MRLVTALLVGAPLFAQQAVIQPYAVSPGMVPVPPSGGGVLGGVVGSSPFFTGRPQGKPASTDCSLDGTVVNKVTGQGIPRAQVVLMGQGQQMSAAADNTGRWSFVNASCGGVQVMASRPGYLPGVSGMSRAGMALRPMMLDAAASVHDVKIELVPQAVVVGRVLDEQGDPVQGAQVSALASRLVQGRRSFMPGMMTQTNDLGEYRLAGLEGGRFIFCARGVNDRAIPNDSTVTGERCYPGPVEGGAATAMQLTSGSENKVDFTLPQVKAVKISGVVLGLPQGMGVSVNLVRRNVGAGLFTGSRGGQMRPDGTFVIQGVTSGAYTITVDFWEGGRRLMARVPVDVGTADLENISVALEPGFTLTGTVRFETAPGAADAASKQINLNLHTADGMMGGGGVQWNKDRTGFTIPDLPPGSYRLDGYAQGKYYVKSATANGRDLTREEVPLGPSAVIDVLVSDAAGTIEGQVTGADDAPVSSSVMAIAEGRPPRSLMTGPDGKFKLAGLVPGDYKVYAWDDMQQVEYANPDWMRRYSGATVSVQPDQSAQVTLKQMTVASQ